MKKVTLQNISVRYITGDFTDIGLKDYVIQKLKRQYHVKEFWAVNDVSFSLEEGDLLGIVGSNGAGKSTLLKVISGIMCPTTGKMSVEGTIASLLELGTGFDGELTVRENTFLRGAMLGYTREFMNKKYEEIIDFSGLGEFQDRRFKQLSSGMKSRLAFSIACLVNPDILILDEVLSVGDGAFRKRASGRWRRSSKTAPLPCWYPTPWIRSAGWQTRCCGWIRASRSNLEIPRLSAIIMRRF